MVLESRRKTLEKAARKQDCESPWQGCLKGGGSFTPSPGTLRSGMGAVRTHLQADHFHTRTCSYLHITSPAPTAYSKSNHGSSSRTRRSPVSLLVLCMKDSRLESRKAAQNTASQSPVKGLWPGIVPVNNLLRDFMPCLSICAPHLCSEN